MSDFGTPNYGKGGFKKKNYFNMSEGVVIARILPPFGDLKEKGVWARFYDVHFGYKNMEGKMRSFLSPLVKNHKTKTVEVPDAALDRLTDLKAKLEKSRMEMNGPLTAKLNQLVGERGIYNIDKNQHMNVVLLDGRIGLLKIRHKMKLALDIEIEKLRAEGVDPLSVENGRFFVFTRTLGGNGGRDTSFSVTVYKEKIDVPGVGKVERDLVHVLSPELQRRAKNEAFDLDKIYIRVTPEEVAQIVAESDLMTGKSPACDRIFDDRWKAERAARNAGNPGNVTATITPIAATTATVTTTAEDAGPDDLPAEPVVLAPKVTASVVTPKAIVTPTVQPKVTTPAQTQAQHIDELSDADFFAQIGVQQ